MHDFRMSFWFQNSNHGSEIIVNCLRKFGLWQSPNDTGKDQVSPSALDISLRTIPNFVSFDFGNEIWIRNTKPTNEIGREWLKHEAPVASRQFLLRACFCSCFRNQFAENDIAWRVMTLCMISNTGNSNNRRALKFHHSGDEHTHLCSLFSQFLKVHWLAGFSRSDDSFRPCAMPCPSVNVNVWTQRCIQREVQAQSERSTTTLLLFPISCLANSVCFTLVNSVLDFNFDEIEPDPFRTHTIQSEIQTKRWVVYNQFGCTPTLKWNTSLDFSIVWWI